MRQWFVLLVCLVSMAVGAPSAYAQCMQAMTETRAEGRLTVGRFADAAGRPETAYILQLSAAVCLDDAEDEDAKKGTRTIQIFSSNDGLARRIQGLVGRDVVVFGQPFGAHTSHHHAPIVMTVSEIGSR
jgi:hypothetical protein